MDEDTWKCYRTNLEFKGRCPLEFCPSNFKNHSSGCANVYLGKETLSVAEIAHITGESGRSIKRKLGVGSANILAVANIIQLLKEVQKQCEECGSQNCNGKEDCKETKILTRAILKELGELAIVGEFTTVQIGYILSKPLGKKSLAQLLKGSYLEDRIGK